jgi:hypothetical protein
MHLTRSRLFFQHPSKVFRISRELDRARSELLETLPVMLMYLAASLLEHDLLQDVSEPFLSLPGEPLDRFDKAIQALLHS